MKPLYIVAIAGLVLASCSTKYHTYQGAQPLVGKGGACENLRGAIWTSGCQRAGYVVRQPINCPPLLIPPPVSFHVRQCAFPRRT